MEYQKRWRPSLIFILWIAWIQQNLKSAYKDSICKLSTFSDWSKNLTIYFGLYTVYWLMLYLKNRNRYQHVLGTKMSIMINFIFNFNTFMGHKINAFQVIKEKHILVGGYLGFWAWFGGKSAWIRPILNSAPQNTLRCQFLHFLT